MAGDRQRKSHSKGEGYTVGTTYGAVNQHLSKSTAFCPEEAELSDEEAEAGREQAIVTEEAQRPMADVKFEHVLEEPWMTVEHGEDKGAKARGAIQRQEGAGHEVRKTAESGVGALVLAEIIGLKR